MDFPEKPCSSCPRIALGLEGPCWSQRAATRHVCQSIALGDPHFVPLVLEQTIIPVDPPGLVEQAAYLLEAVMNHIFDGRPKASSESLAERLTICAVCPNYRPDKSCVLCGCHMPWKASWADMECPEGRWPSIESKALESNQDPLVSL